MTNHTTNNARPVTVAALIREVLEETTLTEPHAVADEVIRRLPLNARAAALAEVLPTFVRTAFSRARMVTPEPLEGAGAPTPLKRKPQSSSKVAACRDDWAAKKQTPVLVGATWKRLGECTNVDLLLLADSIRARAAKMAAKADWYEMLAGSLAPGETVDGLDEMPEVA